MKTQSVPFVSNDDLLQSVNIDPKIVHHADLDVSYGDASHTLLNVTDYKSKVVDKIEDDLTEEQGVALIVALDNLPPGTYIDIEN